MRFRDKVLNPQRPVVLYEILPPRIIDGSVESYAEKISTLLSQTHIDAINIPEIHAEETRGIRPVNGRERAEPRDFGRIIQDSVGIEAIVNRVTVHCPVEEQFEWLTSTCDDFGIENLVLVGGESSKISYSGPSVLETASMINEIMSESGREIFYGGISLPSRPIESKRMMIKGSSGVEFFTTQVLYDSEAISQMLGHYDRICSEKGQLPKRVLLSFAPISTLKNLNFLKWLGVEIPEKTEKYIAGNETEISERSIEISMRILFEILSHIEKEEISVPIGLNVEHIMSYNFDHSVRLLQMMSKKYRRFCLETNLYAIPEREDSVTID